jgi:hypothetical protein
LRSESRLQRGILGSRNLRNDFTHSGKACSGEVFGDRQHWGRHLRSEVAGIVLLVVLAALIVITKN